MLLTVLVVIVVLAYVVESLLDNLNQSTARNPLDPKIAGLYDSQERERSIAYSAENTRFGFYSSTFSTIVMILALTYVSTRSPQRLSSVTLLRVQFL